MILRQPQLRPAKKLACWRRFREHLGPLGVGVDLVVAGSADAERLSDSRWHGFSDVAREGKVLHLAKAQEPSTPSRSRNAAMMRALAAGKG